MCDVVKSKRPHDPEAYSRKLRKLTAASWRAGDVEWSHAERPWFVSGLLRSSESL